MLKTLQRISVSAVGLLALVGAGCSGSGETGDLRVRCADASSFCVTACNLGCTLGGCTVSEIAENQRIQLVFSQEVDPASVNFASMGLVTRSGEAASGEFVVRGATVEFVPDVSVVGGVSQFGFRRNETYVLNLRSGETGEGIRSIAGDGLTTRVNCALQVTRGILDFDQSAPVATLVAPTAEVDVDVTTPIIIEFSEIIDVSPFQGSNTSTTPILYRLKPTFFNNGERVCDLSFPPLLVEGVPSANIDLANNKTTITLQPTINLPAGACVELVITPNVRDISGRGAEEQIFRFTTLPASGQERSITERFTGSAQLDPNVSSGSWGGGAARPGAIGGDGRHGSFDPTIGVALGNGVYEWDTDNMVFPPRVTPQQNTITVTDGKFYFEDFILPAGNTVRFQGSNPVEIRVMGKVEIEGRIECNGEDMTVFGARNTISGALLAGQPGGEGGPGGGQGGRGGNRSDGTGNTPSINGRNGEGVQLKAGHAFASIAANSGGRGSVAWPAGGRSANVQYTVSFVFSGQIQSGGGGGGFDTDGEDGAVVMPFPTGQTAAQRGADTAGGAAFDPFPVPAGAQSIDHFLIGGSGGGGGGSHSYLALTGQALDTWRAGGGGAGGGGAIAIRSGGDLVLVGGSVIEARGGNGATFSATSLASISNTNRAYPSPGGGGSGGSILLQSQTNVIQSGLLDTTGGQPSTVTGVTPTQVAAGTRGGAGSEGFVRLEVPSGLINAGTTIPTASGANVGVLTDVDEAVADISRWYGTQLVFPPTFIRYEMEVDYGNGVVQTFSDDPAVGPLANDPNEPVRLQLQGARVSALTGIADESTIGPWRDFGGDLSGTPSLNNDSATGYRIRLTFNRQAFPNASVRRVTVVIRD